MTGVIWKWKYNIALSVIGKILPVYQNNVKTYVNNYRRNFQTAVYL
jgi:hypothetical protein